MSDNSKLQLVRKVTGIREELSLPSAAPVLSVGGDDSASERGEYKTEPGILIPYFRTQWGTAQWDRYRVER